MAAATVRIRESTREQLRELEGLTGAGPTEVLARAIDSFRRSIILADANIAYQRTLDDPDEAAELAAEREAWEQTLSDGLDDD